MALKILILEDDLLFNETLQDFLQEEGYHATGTQDPYSALDLTFEEKFDLYLFDINLPFESGLDLLAKLRDSNDITPTIFLTSREDKESLQKAFDIGTDDYMKKPIDLDELLLRIRAVLRRQSRHETIDIGKYNLDIISKSLTDKHGSRVELPARATQILIMLVQANGEVLSNRVLEYQLYPASKETSKGAIRVYMTQIRKYFPNALENIRGIGYRFDISKAQS